MLSGLSQLVCFHFSCPRCFELNISTGLAPLFLTVSESQLQTIAAAGAGLLIGTALGVILPEGSEAFRTVQEQGGNVHHCYSLHTNSWLKCSANCTGILASSCTKTSSLAPCVYAAAGGEQRLPDSLFGAVLIGGFVIMLLLDQIHTAVAKGKTFQTSPPPTDNDPEDPWKVQVAKDGPPKKHVWVSTA